MARAAPDSGFRDVPAGKPFSGVPLPGLGFRCPTKFSPMAKRLYPGMLLTAGWLLCLGVPQSPATEVKGAAIKGDRAFGEYLSGTCVTCHQISGQATGGIPPIIAWPEDQFIAVMNAYRAKDRDNLAMRTITAALSDEEIAALAAYFGSLPNQPQIK